jgi:CapZ-interacting protein
MGILDDAIKEHLELKRQHGADDSELKQLENEAFGAAERPGDGGSAPDSLAEAPTEFMTQPEVEVAPEGESATDTSLQPAPQEDAPGRPAPRSEIADLQEAPPSEHDEPAEEEAPAMEHEAVPEPEAPAESISPTGPTTEEREAIAEQPTEMYDIEEELSISQTEAPSEEELVEEGIDEPRLAPVDPLAGLDDEAKDETQDEEYEEDEDFWDEKRLSDELDQALEAPSEVEDRETIFDQPPVTEPEPEPEPQAQPEDETETEEPRPAAREEDVLEETPDFLEEAPEDDELWFEQKPPKDFNFDD